MNAAPRGQEEWRALKFPARRPGEGPTRTCPVCGAEFEPRSRNQKYCCRAHRVAANGAARAARRDPRNTIAVPDGR